MSISLMRRQFQTLRRNALHECGLEEWMGEVRKGLPKRPTPADWVRAAGEATVKCWRCQGTGVYSWGTCLNGRMTHSGPCFRCQGKGRQGQEDFCRNWGYDNHLRVV